MSSGIFNEGEMWTARTCGCCFGIVVAALSASPRRLRAADRRGRDAHIAPPKRDDNAGRFVFMTERGAPMTPAGFRKLIARLGVAAKFPFPIHPHMLRHACGYKLANDGQDTRALQHYLGYKNIMHTVRYTELSPERFKNFWED
jgi:site-specific recombinase XerD